MVALLFSFLHDSGGCEVRNHARKAHFCLVCPGSLLYRNGLLPTPTMRVYIKFIAIDYQIKP